MRNERVIVYIDGSNFYYYCKEIGIASYPNFNFESFVEFIVSKRKLITKKYYIGGVRAKPNDYIAMHMMRKQMVLFSYLKANKWSINKGYLLKIQEKHHEKGVDVKLALDIALDAVDDMYDTAILVSSDTDILPAITQAQNRGKKVEYVGFSNRPSMAMVSKCDTKRLLSRKNLLDFIIKNT